MRYPLLVLASLLLLSAGAVTAANRYEVAGFDDPAAFESLFKKFQTALAADDRDAVLELIDLPVVVNYGTKRVEFGDADDLTAKWDEVFTESVKAAVAGQAIAELFVNAEGVMVGDGILWFQAVGEGDEVSTQVTLNLPAKTRKRKAKRSR